MMTLDREEGRQWVDGRVVLTARAYRSNVSKDVSAYTQN